MMKIGVFRYWEICRHSRAHHMVMFNMLYTYRREVNVYQTTGENVGAHCTKFKKYNAKLYFTSDITYLYRNSTYL